MEQRISVLTLGADDLSAMRAFYEDKLGWKPVAKKKDIVFYQMNGFLFSLAKRPFLADFVGISPEGSGFRAVITGYNVASEAEVREIYDRLKTKGVKIVKQPTVPYFGGLFFYFQDIEGNLLEVAYNPLILLNGHRDAVGHKSIEHL